MQETTKGYVAGKVAELEGKQIQDVAEMEEHERQMDRITARMADRAKLIADLKADVPAPVAVEPVER